MLSVRTSFAALTTEFALQTRHVCRGRAFRAGFRKLNAQSRTRVSRCYAASRTLPAALSRSRNLAFTHFYSFSKLNIPALHETDGKGTVSKVDYFFDSPASFRKLEIEPKK